MSSNSSYNTNSDLNKLAFEVLKKYNVNPDNVSVIQSGTIKTVWKFSSGNKTFCLKRLKQTYDKALFSVNAQIYIKKSGGNVPGIVPDISGQPIVQYSDQLFVVYEWLDGKDLDFNNPADLSPCLQGLAKFHIASKGYIPPEECRVSSKLGKWTEQYNSMKRRMLEWKYISLTRLSLPHHAAYLKFTDSIIGIAENALKLLEESDYDKLTGPGSNSIVLCHQDFGRGNAIMTDKGVCVLDLDGVTFDLPVRDLRKVIGKLADNKGLWDLNTVRTVVENYSAFNPLSYEEKKVLYIDLIFPHWYFGLVKNIFQNDKALKANEIERIAKLEQAKITVLNTLL